MSHPTPTRITRVVICAAIKSSITGKIVCGARNWDSIMRGICIKDGERLPGWLSADQGFIDQYGVWMDRQEAYKIAEAAGQVKFGPEHSRGTLYSEDLY